MTFAIGTRNPWLDVCRSLAIIMVLLSHGRHFLIPAWDGAAVFRIGGFLGVELFFVLSGFLVGGIAERSFKQATASTGWIGRFLLRRWLRTLPNYYLFLTVNALLIAGAITPGSLADLLPFALFVQNLAWPGPAIFGEAWSLAVEEIFYLVLPVSLFWLGKASPDRRRVFVTATFLLLLGPLLARMGVAAFADPTWDDGVRKIVVFRLDALMIGVLTGWLVEEFRLFDRVHTSFLGLLAAIVLGSATGLFFALDQIMNSSFFARVWLFPLVSVGCAMMVLSGMRRTRSRPVVGHAANYCARLSYALYLAHMPVFHLITHFAGSTAPDDLFGAVTRWASFFVGSFFVAALVEYRVERPILEWRDRFIPR